MLMKLKMAENSFGRDCFEMFARVSILFPICISVYSKALLQMSQRVSSVFSSSHMLDIYLPMNFCLDKATASLNVSTPQMFVYLLS